MLVRTHQQYYLQKARQQALLNEPFLRGEILRLKALSNYSPALLFIQLGWLLETSPENAFPLFYQVSSRFCKTSQAPLIFVSQFPLASRFFSPIIKLALDFLFYATRKSQRAEFSGIRYDWLHTIILGGRFSKKISTGKTSIDKNQITFGKFLNFCTWKKLLDSNRNPRDFLQWDFL